MATLSLCMIVKDEAGFLEHCLESVKDIVDEIIVIDTGSKDNTKIIAKQHGSQVFDFVWKDDFSAARNFAIDKATSNWILVLDADEILDAQGKKEILTLINNREYCLKDLVGFKLEQRTYNPKAENAKMTADPVALARDYSNYEQGKLVRVFKNHPKIHFKNKVHELVENSIRDNKGDVVDTNIILHHFSLLKKEKIAAKTENYTDLLWKQLEAEPENPRYNRQVALIFLEKGKYELALKYLKRTLSIDAKFPGLFADFGKLFIKMQQPVRAIKYLNMAIAYNKKDTASLNNLSVIYISMGKYDLAQRLLEIALAAEPENEAVRSNYAQLKEKIKQHKK